MENKRNITILMPCLNEEKTIVDCIEEAKLFLDQRKDLIDGEILIVDNHSTDRSAEFARKAGALVVTENKRGYGNALRCGFSKAKGDYIIYGDCDGSYDFLNLDDFMKAFAKGADFVAGNRFAKEMESGAMKWTHKYIGVPALSLLGRMRYRTEIRDFHCGLRGIRKAFANQLDLSGEGMEFATEIIAKTVQNKGKIVEVPVRLRKDKRNGASHLRTVRDGIRHLFYIIKNGI